jgi:FkbM family methyltransferase
MLASLGVRTYTTTRYPVVDLKVTTQFDGSWRRVALGEMELNCIRQLSRVVREGSTVFDIGAWHGTYTLLLSHLVGKSGRVYAFEPVPGVRDVLVSNVNRNRMANVRIEPFCLSNSVGEVTIHVDPAGGTLSSMVSPLPGGRARDLVVPAITVDKYCEENDVWPEGIKLDVEGAEGMVIEGCQKVIDKCSPWLLLEFHGQLFPEVQRRLNWEKITGRARKVVFIEGRSDVLSYGSEMRAMPETPYFHAFVQY